MISPCPAASDQPVLPKLYTKHGHRRTDPMLLLAICSAPYEFSSNKDLLRIMNDPSWIVASTRTGDYVKRQQGSHGMEYPY